MLSLILLKNKGDNMRENYINWDSYFMGIAILSSMRSKDPNTQVGACIVNEDKRIVGVGYNGLPKGCDDKEFPWERDGEFLNTKYPYVCHAELNAILNSIKSLKDCIIYVALFPCHECTKAIIQSGIKEIEAIMEAVFMCRDLVNRPANDIYPETLAKFAKEEIGKVAVIMTEKEMEDYKKSRGVETEEITSPSNEKN